MMEGRSAVKTKTIKRQKKSHALVIRGKKSVPKAAAVAPAIFWPDRIDHVKAIAMRGLADNEMASILGVSEPLLNSWRKYYPEFNQAIEDGRSLPDQQVLAALHANAIGYERDQDVVVRTRRGSEIVTAKVFYPGETAAQRYWLNNRAPKYWKDRSSHDVSSKNLNLNANAAVKPETKDQVINSIINLITPQPDS